MPSVSCLDPRPHAKVVTGSLGACSGRITEEAVHSMELPRGGGSRTPVGGGRTAVWVGSSSWHLLTHTGWSHQCCPVCRGRPGNFPVGPTIEKTTTPHPPAAGARQEGQQVEGTGARTQPSRARTAVSCPASPNTTVVLPFQSPSISYLGTPSDADWQRWGEALTLVPGVILKG